jgi:tetratricopeptide (TPR) repeat protein
MRASVRLQAAPNVTSNAEGNAQSNEDALNDVNQALQIAANDPTALRIRGNILEALNRTDEGITDYKNALAQDPFQAESREALVRLGQEVPPEEGQTLGEEVAGWVIKEPQPGRYVASNAKYPALRPELEMFGAGKPKILEWKLLKDALSGIGLLKYYAGDFGDGQESSLEYVAIVDTRANKVISVEPHAWGASPAQWNWQAVSVVVTDPDGNKNEVQLRKARQRAPVARDDFWGFGAPILRPKAPRGPPWWRRWRRWGRWGRSRGRWRNVQLAVPVTLFLASVRDAEEANCAWRQRGHRRSERSRPREPSARLP